jgi:hypothetical protein
MASTYIKDRQRHLAAVNRNRSRLKSAGFELVYSNPQGRYVWLTPIGAIQVVNTSASAAIMLGALVTEDRSSCE